MPLLQQTRMQFHEMVRRIIMEASSDAIMESLSMQSWEMRNDEADRVETLTDAYLEHLDVIIYNQLSHDARQAMKRYELFWLNVELAQYRSNLTFAQAISSERDAMIAEEYVRHDRKGRAWRSERYLHVESMKSITDLFNATTIYLLGRRGEDTVRIHQPGHERHNLEFNLMDYPLLEAEHFHPNSPALLVKVSY